MMEWQTIDTAPKDEWIIVYYDNMSGVGMAMHTVLNDFWLDWDGDVYGTPTHWMPLPDLPKENK